MAFYTVTLFSMLCLVLSTTSSPAGRPSRDLEARRRSAIDRNVIRFGRSYPAPITAQDLKDAIETNKRPSTFIRLGRSQPITLTTDDLISLLKYYNDDDYIPASKRAADFIRYGRTPNFIRFGRSSDDEKINYENPAELPVNTNQQRKSRAHNHFLRLGRDSEELNDGQLDMYEDETGDRRKRSVE